MTLALQKFDTWNSNVNMYVANCQFSADIDFMSGEFRADYGAPPAPSAAGIVNGGSMVAAGVFNTFAADYKSKLTPWGRQLVFAAGAATTNVINILGRDYLGQPIRENLTLASATPVNTVKIYKSIDSLTFVAATATPFTIGWTDVLGVPFRTMAVQNWLEGGTNATAGTLVAGASATAAQTISSADPRGSVDFNAATNGTLTLAIIGIADVSQIYGARHFGG